MFKDGLKAIFCVILASTLAGCSQNIHKYRNLSSPPIYKHSTFAKAPRLVSVYHPVTRPQKKPYFILSIDSGALAGYLPARVLAYIEKNTGKPISQLFDMVASTSSGSLTAAGLALVDAHGNPRFTAAEISNFYKLQAQAVLATSSFRKLTTLNSLVGPKYLDKPKKQFMERLTHGIKLSDLRMRLVFWEYSLQLQGLYAFDTAKAKKSPHHDFYLSDCLLASTAPPMLFSPYYYCNVNKSFCDRGIDVVYMNNPALQAYLLARKEHPEREIVLVSLGTGIPRSIISHQQIQYSVQKWGVDRLPVYLQVMLLGTNQMSNQQMDLIADNFKGHLMGYYRFDGFYHKTPNYFSAKAENFSIYDKTYHQIITENHKDLQALIQLLKHYH